MPHRLLQEVLQTPAPRLPAVEAQLDAVHAVAAAERVALHRIGAPECVLARERDALVMRGLADRRLEALRRRAGVQRWGGGVGGRGVRAYLFVARSVLVVEEGSCQRVLFRVDE